MENQDDRKPKREGRSPGYPGIDLETALQRAKQIKEREQRHFAPLSVVCKHWGYAMGSGPALRTTSALIHYGLLEVKGTGDNREVRLSDSAWRILTDPRPDSPERDALIREAALKPSIHQKMWEKYQGDPPSEATFLVRLRQDEGFTERGAKEFIREFDNTLAFAKLKKGDNLAGHEEDKTSIIEEDLMSTTPERTESGHVPPPRVTETRNAPVDPGMGTISFPLSAKKWVKVELPYQLTEPEWKRIKDTLDVFKPGFVKETAESNAGDE